jgi:hypothetical protein
VACQLVSNQSLAPQKMPSLQPYPILYPICNFDGIQQKATDCKKALNNQGFSIIPKTVVKSKMAFVKRGLRVQIPSSALPIN